MNARKSFTYRGIWVVALDDPGGYRLPWSARLDDGTRLSADTKRGIQALIREALA